MLEFFGYWVIILLSSWPRIFQLANILFDKNLLKSQKYILLSIYVFEVRGPKTAETSKMANYVVYFHSIDLKPVPIDRGEKNTSI